MQRLHCVLTKTWTGISVNLLKIWDPFYCEGAVVAHLASLGYKTVHNKPVDFWAEVAAGRIPEHHVVVTNPAYSGDHIPRLLDFVASNNKPSLLLLPHWVYKKDYFVPHRTNHFYICPSKRYFYRNGHIGDHEKAPKVTAPWDSFWYIALPGHNQRFIQAWNDESPDQQSAGLRLAHSFLKRRGDPGFHTALNSAGKIIGKLRPENPDQEPTLHHPTKRKRAAGVLVTGRAHMANVDQLVVEGKKKKAKRADGQLGKMASL